MISVRGVARAAVVAAMVLLAAGAVQAITIDTVPVGKPGNAADTHGAGYGAVAYTYNIGKYEVTAGQYTAFLNAVGGVDTYALYNTLMSRTDYGSGIARSGGGTVANPYTYSVATDFTNRPVNYVSFWDACRFANWLNNGQQGAGTTEYGAYSLNGVTYPNNSSITRNTGWQWAVTSEDEWYKAAYYNPVTGTYYDCPTSSNSMPGRDMTETASPGNNANYYGNPYPIDSPYCTTVVGEFELSDSPYGTFDQGGNVVEWNEAILQSGSARGLRGGAFGWNNFDLYAWYRFEYGGGPTGEGEVYGFRVSAVPEPVTMAGMVLGIGGLVGYIRRRMAR